jgi:hypothetical protein
MMRSQAGDFQGGLFTSPVVENGSLKPRRSPWITRWSCGLWGCLFRVADGGCAQKIRHHLGMTQEFESRQDRSRIVQVTQPGLFRLCTLVGLGGLQPLKNIRTAFANSVFLYDCRICTVVVPFIQKSETRT